MLVLKEAAASAWAVPAAGFGCSGRLWLDGGERGNGNQKPVVKRLQKGWPDAAVRVFPADSCPCRRILLTRRHSGHSLLA